MKEMLRTVLVCILLFAVVANISTAATKIYLTGNLNGQIRYTPEGGIEALRLFKVNSWMETKNKPFRVLAVFETVGDDFAWAPVENGLGGLNTSIKNLTLQSETPLYYGGSSCLLSIGDVNIDYSPLIAKMDGNVRVNNRYFNPLKRGVSIENLDFPIGQEVLQTSSFFILDSNKVDERMPKALAIGGKVSTYIANSKVGFTYVKRMDQLNQELLDARKVAGNNTAVEEQDAFLFEVEKNWNGGQAELRAAQNTNKKTTYFTTGLDAADLERGNFFAVKYGKDLGNGAKTSLEFVSVDPNFSPVYRDRTPRCNEAGKFINWNYLDSIRYIPLLPYSQAYKQMQYKWKTDFEILKNQVGLDVEKRLLLNGKEHLGEYASCNVRWLYNYGNTSVSTSSRFDTINYNLGTDYDNVENGMRLKWQIRHKFSENETSKSFISYTNNREGLVFDSLGEQRLVLFEREGKLPNNGEIKMFAGYKQTIAPNLEKEMKSGLVGGLTINNKQGLNLEVKYATHNQVEDPSRLYDLDGIDYIGYDNIVRVGVSTSF